MTPSEEQEFVAFVRTRGDGLLRYARLLVPDPAEAEDVLQVALMGVLRHWSRHLAAPEAYVRAAILNSVRDGARRRHLVPVPVETSDHQTDEGVDLAEAGAARARLDHLLGLLPPRQRAAVVLRLIEGLNEAETAVTMACSPGTVKSNLARGLDKVRAALLVERGQMERTRR